MHQTSGGGSRHTDAVTTATDLPNLQRRTLGTLVGSQVLGGVGVSSGIAVGSLLAEDVAGSATYAGLANTFQVLGAAFIAVPMARVMAARGRRPGLVVGYGLALVGAALILTAGAARSFPLLLGGALLFGGATASNNQARYAAADLSEPTRRGRDLAVVVWSTTVGAVLGPNLVGPAGVLAVALGLPPLTGPFLFSLVGFTLAVVVLVARLRPDPLLEARRRTTLATPATHVAAAHGSVVRGFRVIASTPVALLGLVTIALGHAVMVSVMVMTPLHMRHGDASLEAIGLVISIHVIGMFAFSPLTGLATDRLGGRAVALVGSAVLIAAALLAARAPEGSSAVLTAGLLLLGLGWSCTLVSGSTLLTNAVAVSERAGAQGASDLAMGLAGGGGGALAGVVVAHYGYEALALSAVVVAAAVGAVAMAVRPRRATPSSA